MEESEMCVICGRTSKEANLLNAVLGKEKEVSKVCEACAIIEQAVVIPKPTKKQLEQAEIPYTVYERLARMSGVKGERHLPRKVKPESINLNFLQSTKQAGIETKSEQKKEGKGDIKILETEEGKSAVIDFSSKNLKIGDLQKLRKKVLE